MPAAPDWQGRSLFDTTRSPRAYFYVAEDHFTLGRARRQLEVHLRSARRRRGAVRSRPRSERAAQSRHGRARARTARLRQRLAAWTEANRRQYEHADHTSSAPEVTQRPCRHCVRDRAPGHLAHSPACRIAHRRHGYTVVWLKSLHAAHQLSTTLRETPNIDVDS